MTCLYSVSIKNKTVCISFIKGTETLLNQHNPLKSFSWTKIVKAIEKNSTTASIFTVNYVFHLLLMSPSPLFLRLLFYNIRPWLHEPVFQSGAPALLLSELSEGSWPPFVVAALHRGRSRREGGREAGKVKEPPEIYFLYTFKASEDDPSFALYLSFMHSHRCL